MGMNNLLRLKRMDIFTYPGYKEYRREHTIFYYNNAFTLNSKGKYESSFKFTADFDETTGPVFYLFKKFSTETDGQAVKIIKDDADVGVKNSEVGYSNPERSYVAEITLADYTNYIQNGTIDEYNRIDVIKYKGYKTDKELAVSSSNTNGTNGNGGGGYSYDYNQCTDGWWKCAWSFLSAGSFNEDYQFGTNTGANSALNDIKNMLSSVGNIIFLLVTAYLGVKYIWGGVDSKYSVKNSLMTLVVAAIVFYGWGAVTDILDVQDLLTGQSAASGVDSMTYKIYNTIMYIINVAAVAGIIYIGIRYMVAGAEGKSELKLKAIPVIMGIIMVYGTVNLINFILKIVASANTV